MMWWQDARQAGHSELGSLVVNDSFNPCVSMKAWSKDLVRASTRRSDGERFSSRTIPLSDNRSVCYDVAWEKLTASSLLDSLSDTGAVDEVLSDGERLSYFKLLGQVFATRTRYSMTRRYEGTRIYEQGHERSSLGQCRWESLTASSGR